MKIKLSNDAFGIGVMLSIIALIIAGIAGWVMNIITIANTMGAELTGLFVLRVAGIFVPFLGAVLGWV